MRGSKLAVALPFALVTALLACASAPPAPVPTTSTTAPSASALPTAEPVVTAPPAPPPPRRARGLARVENRAPLFEDELAAIEGAALKQLGTIDDDVLSAEELSALRGAVRAGAVREGGATCLVPPTLEDAFFAAFPEGKLAALDLACVGATCRPRLTVFDARGASTPSREVLGREASAIDPASWAASLAEGAWADPAPPAAPTFAPGKAGPPRNGPLAAHALTCFGACKKPPALTLFPSKHWKTCANDQVRVLAAFDEGGRAGTCAADACACEGLTKVSLPKADGARRLFVDFGPSVGGPKPTMQGTFGGGLHMPFKVLRGMVTLVPPIAPASRYVPEMRRELSRCLYETRKEDATISATLRIGESGLIEDLTLPEESGFGVAETKCLKETLPKVMSFTCPGATNVVEATLQIKARKQRPAKTSPGEAAP